jgi:hypothetical protein
LKSPLFDNESGFGGNGAKVANPFADMLNMLGIPNIPNMPKMSDKPNVPSMEGHSHSHSQPQSHSEPRGSPNGLQKEFPNDILTGLPNLLKGILDGFAKSVPGGLSKAFPGGFAGGPPAGVMSLPEAPIFMGTGGGCVSEGPFKDMKLHIGPFGIMKENNTRCLKRSFNAALVNSAATKEVFDKILGSKNFGEFRKKIEMPAFGTGVAKFGPNDFHSLGHGGVGGEVCS